MFNILKKIIYSFIRVRIITWQSDETFRSVSTTAESLQELWKHIIIRSNFLESALTLHLESHTHLSRITCPTSDSAELNKKLPPKVRNMSCNLRFYLFHLLTVAERTHFNLPDQQKLISVCYFIIYTNNHHLTGRVRSENTIILEVCLKKANDQERFWEKRF